MILSWSKYGTTCLAVAAMALLSSAAEPTPIRLPRAPEPPTPLPAPIPPDQPMVLTAELLYVIDSDVPVIVTPSRRGYVTVTEEAGPIKIKGRFADEPNKVQSRTFTGKHVVTVEALRSGSVELFVIPKGVQEEKDILRRLLEVQDGTKPQPPPKPEPGPTPADPSPFPADVGGLRVLVVYEQSTPDRPLSNEMGAIIVGTKVRDYLDKACGKTGYRFYDKDTPMANESKIFVDAMARPRKSIPWVLIGNGKTGYEGPLPETEAAFLELVKKYEVTK